MWWVKDPLDAATMREAARLSWAFTTSAPSPRHEAADETRQVKMEPVHVAEEGGLILLRIVGSHFLWKMVRRLVGVLAEVGRGELSERTSRASCAGFQTPPLTAPPSGLFLERVRYEGDPVEPPPLRSVMNLGFAAEPPTSTSRGR